MDLFVFDMKIDDRKFTFERSFNQLFGHDKLLFFVLYYCQIIEIEGIQSE